jgi:hypothetical protein
VKKLFFIVLIAVGASFISMCEKEDIIFDANATTFRGFVLDSVSRVPIDSVKVSPLDTLSGLLLALTDTAGLFEIYDPNGRSKFPSFFLKSGYETVLCTLVAGRRDTILIQ